MILRSLLVVVLSIMASCSPSSTNSTTQTKAKTKLSKVREQIIIEATTTSSVVSATKPDLNQNNKPKLKDHVFDHNSAHRVSAICAGHVLSVVERKDSRALIGGGKSIIDPDKRAYIQLGKVYFGEFTEKEFAMIFESQSSYNLIDGGDYLFIFDSALKALNYYKIEAGACLTDDGRKVKIEDLIQRVQKEGAYAY